MISQRELTIEVTDELVARFNAKWVQQGDCRIWTAAPRGNGYGAIKVGGRVIDAHRVAWIIEHRKPLPAGVLVKHSCEVKLCVYHGHLSLGTDSDNARDAVETGAFKPFRPKRTKPLTSREIVELCDDFDRGMSQRELCRKHNVAPTSLKRLLRRHGLLEVN